MKILGKLAAALVALLAIAEIALRMAGVLDFPLFHPGPPYGYIPRPNKSGTFLGKNDWVFNELSMGTARRFETPGTTVDTLLIGDSIVSGGNPYRQVDRLGPQLEKRIGGRVWPISANSWSLANELTYVRLNSDAARRIDQFIFITNSEDFGAPSVWRSPITHPTRRPKSAIIYIFQKKFVRTPSAPAKPYSPRGIWLAFKSKHDRPVTVIAYPTKKEATNTSLRQAKLINPLRELVGADTILVDVGADPRWASAQYRDDIHPDPNSTALLATIIADSIEKTEKFKSSQYKISYGR